jgi:type VI secretion system protein ImpC
MTPDQETEGKKSPKTEKIEAPASLLDEILEATRLTPADEGYAITKRGVQAFIDELLKPGREEARPTTELINEMIADLDQKLSGQLDTILHHPDFQRLESSWRSLKFLVDRTNFRENTKLEILNVSKQDLFNDFEDAAEVVTSGLYKKAYTEEFGVFGGQPYAMMIGNYEFGTSAQDMRLLQNLASVSAMSHAPFIGAVNAQMFGLDKFEALPNLKELNDLFEMPQYAKWRGFRESADAQYVGLVLPHFLLRPPYSADTIPAKTFNYKEEAAAGSENYLWGNAAFAFATRITDSFAESRMCANIIGPQGGGAVNDLPVYNFEAMGDLQTKIPTEIMISDRKEFELAEQGFIALTMRKGSDNAAFFSANSCQRAKQFGDTPEGKQAELNFKLGTQLPYMMVVNRLAHYLKVLQRENIGTWKGRAELETELNNWIRQYISDQENPGPGVRSRRPLRRAQIIVSDVAGDPGWYKVEMKVQPHFKYMGASFELSLVGKLDKE